MKVNVWGINYAPELTGIGVYNTGLCEYLDKQGDDVTMVTGFPYYPHWRLFEGASGLYRTDTINGVKVCRCAIFVPSNPTPLTRIVHEASFVLSSFLRQLTLPAPDIYVVVSPPLLLGFAAWLISMIKRTPFVFHVQDLQPDAAAGLSMLKEGPFMRALYALEKFSYEKARLVSAISPEMCSLIKGKGIEDDKIVVFPNWVESPQGCAPGSWKARNGIDSKTSLITYAGNLGVKQGLSVVVEAARIIDGSPVKLVIAGNGAEAHRLRQMKSEYGLNNLLLFDVLPESEHTDLLMDSDICLIPQKKGATTAFLPSKLLKILAPWRLVVAITEDSGALAGAISAGGFGITVEPDNARALADVLIELLADSDKRAAMGLNGMEYVKRFSLDHVLKNFRKHLARVIEDKGK